MAERIYDPTQIESRWQKWWDENKVNEVDLEAAKNPYYVLMMFPYPSAEGLHVGNVYAFTGADIQGRYRRLRGHDVFEPIGFDAFGIHSENFAMKVNRHPRELIPSNIANFTRQLKMMGFMFDWNRTVDTTTPEYYKWTQWVFLQLYKAGFVYRDTKEVNFCPDCGTVIADEQVNPDGTCERHSGTMVERRKMPCWFFKITALADRLVDNHDWLDWSDTTKLAQLNWIRRSKGAEVDFAVAGTEEKIRVFTTRPDTLFGATFMVLSPEHPLVNKITHPDKLVDVDTYREKAAQKSAEERADDAKEKTGVDTGAFAINPVTGEPLPIYIADYVLMGYGTGAIMAVPSGDHRDFAFAKQFGITVKPIIDPDMSKYVDGMLSGLEGMHGEIETSDELERAGQAVRDGNAAWSGPGTLINSGNDKIKLDGLSKEDAIARMCEWLEAKGHGTARNQFRLRDWGISRQRYWGPPIPIIYDDEGNIHPVPKSELPVALPDMDDFRPKGDGQGPLANAEEWVNCTAPNGRPGRRETDVMDNFLDSAWYFLRYISSNDEKQAYDPKLIEKWLPVDIYIGGNEHAVLHLLYTRFICMALTEAGVLKMGERPEMKDRAEPFRKFRAHGLLIKEGHKMSKSKGNVVNPDEFVANYGADCLRTYLMFLGPYTQGGDFQDKDIQGVRRFLNRSHGLFFGEPLAVADEKELDRGLLVKFHQTVKKVGEDIEALSYNTALAAMMEFLNAVKSAGKWSDAMRTSYCVMLAPFAPYLCEEIWHEALGQSSSVFTAKWPIYDPALTVLDEIEVPIQVNGKIRDRITVARTISKDDLEKMALESEAVKSATTGDAEVRKVVVVPGRLVNVIVK